jgi:hypothetical protein
MAALAAELVPELLSGLPNFDVIGPSAVARLDENVLQNGHFGRAAQGR